MKRDDSNVTIDSFSLEDVKREKRGAESEPCGPRPSLLPLFSVHVTKAKTPRTDAGFLPLFTPTTCKGKIGGGWTLVARGEDARSSLVAEEAPDTGHTRVSLFCLLPASHQADGHLTCTVLASHAEQRPQKTPVKDACILARTATQTNNRLIQHTHSKADPESALTAEHPTPHSNSPQGEGRPPMISARRYRTGSTRAR